MLTALTITAANVLLMLVIIMFTAIFSDDEGYNKKRITTALVIFSVIACAYTFLRNSPSAIGKTAALMLLNAGYFAMPPTAFPRHKLKGIYIALAMVMLDGFFCSVLRFFALQLKLPYSDDLISSLIALGVRIMLFLSAYKIIRARKAQLFHITAAAVPRYIYVLIILSLFSAGGLTAFISSGIETKALQTITQAFALILSVTSFIVVISLLANTIMKSYYADITALLKKQVNSQLRQYELAEQRNKEIRAFRHDYINNMNCIRAMLEEKQYGDLEEYISKYSLSFPHSKYAFNTGNYIADAILSDKSEVCRNAEIHFDGIIPRNIDSTDLCTVLSNALDNAAEAVNALPEAKEKYIIVITARVSQGYFLLSVKNPSGSGTALTTTKQDKINHGFGLANIKATVAKLNGTTEIIRGDNSFELKIAFGLTEPASADTAVGQT